VVVGADGRESFVARQVGASEYNPGGGTTAGFYSYFKNFSHSGPEFHLGGGVAHFVFPTNDGEVCLGVEMTADKFKEFRGDLSENLASDLSAFEPLAERFKSAERTDKIFGLAPHKSFYRKPYGPGWALAGDAGYYRDPLLGQGINDAFRDADTLADALDAGFAGRQEWDSALAAYEADRNAATAMVYGLTNLLCQDLDPSPQILQMMAAGLQPAAPTG
jgi:2-polyprenyl-6-methoxyphenol hydroxylase-like FAD-dependent oxidoreductase